tara:strand:+ start:8921 stop:9625 length:705 start_codon:yes stop_codon:yes gene_type:complete
MKILNIILALLFFNLHADEGKLRSIISESYPDLQIKKITKTNYNDLYEIFLGDQIVYSDESFSFLIIEGRLVNPKTRVDLTSARLDELTRVNFKNLPFEMAIKVVKGNGEREIAVFSDIDCPFCKKLEKETISEMSNITIYNFLFPLDIHPKAKAKSSQVWCSPDRSEAWNNAMLYDKLAKNDGNCDTPINDIITLARDLGVTSTPTIILSSGKRLPGALSAEDLEKYLDGTYD